MRPISARFMHQQEIDHELETKSAAMHLRLPQALLDAVKHRAQQQGWPHTRYVRLLLENDLAQARKF